MRYREKLAPRVSRKNRRSPSDRVILSPRKLNSSTLLLGDYCTISTVAGPGVTRDTVCQRLSRPVKGTGKICHRHRRHPQDPQDEVQPRLVLFRCRMECCCCGVEKDHGRRDSGFGWMGRIGCGCGVYGQSSCAHFVMQTSPPPVASRARRTSRPPPPSVARSCLRRLRRISAASTTYVAPDPCTTSVEC